MLGVGVFAAFMWWLLRRFVRSEEPPLTLAETLEAERTRPLDVRRLDRFADALERARRIPQARYSDRR